MGISLANLPEKYLGVKLITGRVTREVVSNIVDTLIEKLSRYKGRIMPFTTRREVNQGYPYRLGGVLYGYLQMACCGH